MARTPSREAHEKVLRAAADLIAERGVEDVSMDAIAAASGVSKATLYKHWPNKHSLLIDVLQLSGGELPEFDTGDPRADLTALVRYIAEHRKSRDLSRVWPRVFSYAMAKPEFGRTLREHSTAPRRKQLVRILTKAAEMGQIRKGIDPAIATDLLIGPLMHHRFDNHESPVPTELTDAVVDSFWGWAQEAGLRNDTPRSSPQAASGGSATSQHTGEKPKRSTR